MNLKIIKQNIVAGIKRALHRFLMYLIFVVGLLILIYLWLRLSPGGN